MPSAVTPIPTDRPRLSAYLTLRYGAAAIAYYQHVFVAV